jgi:hypothetical protein
MFDRKARPRLTDLAGVARQVPSGMAFSLVTLLLATQEKVTRPQQEDESPCANSHWVARSLHSQCAKSIP